ncbi:MAG TPA: T9SS type A sorting domain-containing protein, partial [Ignavibacteria bacterium]|nr:T9SS type A sorting domain-containing protein [Ignavibacteria bacterium]
ITGRFYELTNVGNKVWACGNNGMILYNEVITGVGSNTGEIPAAYSLGQNYPNPFNPETKISFDIAGSKSSNVKLIVYNSLGEKAGELVNQVLTPGSYSYTFKGAGLPSGVYYYKLITDGFTETKKMLLVK